MKIPRDIFQGDALSPLLFLIAVIPHTHIISTGNYKLTKSKDNINHLMYMKNIKLSAKRKKELVTIRIYGEYIGRNLA